MMAHVKVVGRWEDGTPTPIPPEAIVRTHSGGGKCSPFFTAVYVDGKLQIRAQHSDDDTTALIASAFLGSNHVRLFGPGEVGITPILEPKISADWDTTTDALGFTISSHTMIISVPHEKIEAIQRYMFEQWPQSGREATARDVLSMAGKLWNLTYVVRAGGYFVWRLLRLTGLHNSGGTKNQNHTVGLGREFDAGLLV